MVRFLSRRCFFTVAAVSMAAATPVSAQLALTPAPLPVNLMAGRAAQIEPVPGELHGVISDDRGEPLAGAVVSALGETTVFAVTDREGRFGFRKLPAGPYLVRVHLQGYLPARARILQVVGGTRRSATFALLRLPEADDASPPVLAAGVGAPEAPEDNAAAEDEHEHDEVAWRLRHLRRSVLKEAENAAADLGRDRSLMGDSLSNLGRAFEGSARLATSLFADLPLSGQFNLLTTASFNRPQDLFAVNADVPRSVAYLSLEAPGAQGDWRVRGTITQGDVASWILAASYARHEGAAHRYQAGVSYSTQRYFGGNAEALAAIRDGGRNVGSMYAYDDWAVVPRVRLGYGAKYASYDYLADRGLFSPRASVTVQPASGDSFTLRATVSHRETAPGAEEFLPPTVGLWLPPERTFSHVSRAAFLPERLDHVEIAAEREWPGNLVVGVRAFSQRVEDQVVTLFGLSLAEPATSIGHYQVGYAGDLGARGWGVSVSRTVVAGIRASVDYTAITSEWRRRSPDVQALLPFTGGALLTDDRIHDLAASIESVVAPTSTRVFVLYRMNSAFAAEASPVASARFNVQVNQALPFLDFTNAEWEMLMAVSNLFRDALVDASVFDELLVIRPPKRVLGGVTVRF